MSGSINKVILIGNLGQDPEIRTTQDGKEIANFSLATNENWIDKATGERRDRTEWHRIAIFQQGLIGIVKKYVKKGSKLYIEGSLQTRKWTDSNGVDKYSTEVVLQAFSGVLTMLDSRNNNSGGNYNNSYQSGQSSGNSFNNNSSSKQSLHNNNQEDLDDEIPF